MNVNNLFTIFKLGKHQVYIPKFQAIAYSNHFHRPSTQFHLYVFACFGDENDMKDVLFIILYFKAM